MTTPQKHDVAPQKNTETNRVWIHDPITIAHTDVSDKGIVYTVVFQDFMGLSRKLQINRSDCYFNFPSVVTYLVSHGFRFNILAPNSIHRLQRVEQVKQAIEQNAALNATKSKGATPLESIATELDAETEHEDDNEIETVA